MLKSVEELYKSTINPRINDISLDLLREYYEVYLEPNEYRYSYTQNGIEKTITLRLPKDNFCHLLGIETILKGSVPYKDLCQYKGLNGWENIKDKVLNFKFLKDKNKKRFNGNKSKMVYFYLLPELLCNGKIIDYKEENVEGKTTITCDLMFYDRMQNAYVHLGIKFDEDLNYYIPKTFLIEKITAEKDGKKFIDKQETINIIDRNVE